MLVGGIESRILDFSRVDRLVLRLAELRKDRSTRQALVIEERIASKPGSNTLPFNSPTYSTIEFCAGKCTRTTPLSSAADDVWYQLEGLGERAAVRADASKQIALWSSILSALYPC